MSETDPTSPADQLLDQEGIQRIEAELAAITPGPWKLRYLTGRHPVRSLSVMQESASGDLDLALADVWLPLPWRGAGEERERRGQVAERQADADAEFIKNAPTHIRQLLEALRLSEQRNREVEGERDRLREAVGFAIIKMETGETLDVEGTPVDSRALEIACSDVFEKGGGMWEPETVDATHERHRQQYRDRAARYIGPYLRYAPSSDPRLGWLAEENDRLRADLDAAQLRSIEARNPGIDMEEVRRVRAALADTEAGS